MAGFRLRIGYGSGGGSGITNNTAPLTSFSLTSASSGTIPYSLGQVFKKGDVPSGVVLTANTTTYQILPISLWDDGSIKHAVVSGTASLVGGVSSTFTFGKGSGPSGTTLSESSLITAAPTATVAYGAAGTVSLASLLGTSALKITEQAGPVYASFQYVANFPSDSTLRAVFYVQLWASGAYRVRCAVEYGRPLDSFFGTSKTGTATITIAGTQVLNQSVTMLPGNRFDAEGGSFSYPIVLHDVDYWRASKLIPNYSFVNPSATSLNALTNTYTPIGLGGWIDDMGTTGFAPHIGLLPHWDAMYMTSGDVRAKNAVLINGRSYGTYGVYWRDATTNRMPKPSDYTSAYSGSEDVDQRGSGGHRWEFAHHPNAGYLPWLTTAERFHLETIQANAWTAYYTCPPTGGVSRIYNSQTRGRAWRFRSACVAAAVSPTSDVVAADYRTGAAANLAQLKIDRVDTGLPGTGLVWTYDDKDSGTAGFQHSIFESLFAVSSLGFCWDIEPGFDSTAKTNHQLVRDFAYKVPVGLTGQGQAATEYNWRRAPGPYRMVIGSDGTLANLYNTWNEVNLATYGSDSLSAAAGSTILESYADDPSADAFPQGNWGHVITALSYAVDHGAAGAQAGMDRVLGASNWSSNATKFNNWPAYGVLQRTPAWYGTQSTGTWKNLGASFMTGLGPQSGMTPSGVEHSTVGPFSYSGGFTNNRFFYDRLGNKKVGAAQGIHGGGHNAEASNEMSLFRLYDQTWYRIRDGYSSPTAEATVNPDGTPVSVHTYDCMSYADDLNIMVRAISAGIYGTSGSTSFTSWRFDFNNLTPNGTGPGPWTQNPNYPNPGTGVEGAGVMSCYDSDNRQIIAVTPGRVRFAYFNTATATWTQKPEGNPISYSDRGVMCYIPGKQWVVVHIPTSGGSEPFGLLVADPTIGTPTFTAMTTAGSPPSSSTLHGLTWDSFNGRLVACDEVGNLKICTPPSTISGTWTWSTLSSSGDTPESETGVAAGEGIWGRFSYIDDGVLRGYLLLAGPHTKPAFYKLGG
jgi:hypothetical protein